MTPPTPVSNDASLLNAENEKGENDVKGSQGSITSDLGSVQTSAKQTLPVTSADDAGRDARKLRNAL